MHYLELGGAEKALIGLLDAIDKDAYSVDLFLNQHTGAFLSMIPDKVNLLPEIPEYAALEQPLSFVLRKGMWGAIYRKLKCNLALKRYLRKHPYCHSVASHIYMDNVIEDLPDLHFLGEYDLAISFLDPPHIVQDKVLSKKKIEWIHTDFKTINYDSDLTFSRWATNDYIISISEAITESFSSIFPKLKHKLKLIENIISPVTIYELAVTPINNENQTTNLFKICSIGRINAESKNFKCIPEVASILTAKGLDFEWQIIGPGDSTSLQTLIKEYSVSEKVKVIGPRENPYPYIKSCNVYVQPSIYEGKSIAVREAQILCKPVIITNYPTSSSQVVHNVDGLICEMDTNSIAEAILDIANNPEKARDISDYLSCHDYGMMTEINKLYDLF